MCSSSEIDEALDLISEHLEGLFSYPDWLPIERYEISHYCEQFKVKRSLCMSNMNQRSSEEIQDLSAVCRDKANFIGRKVSNILDEKNKNSSTNARNLRRLGISLKAVLVWLYRVSSIKKNNYGLISPSFTFVFDFDFDKKKFESYISNVDGEICVGFESEGRDLLERLTSITVKHLQVISIVGMAGIGKTTLARKVYNDPLSVYHFYIRAWVSVSQVYQKRDLLIGILSSSIIELTDEVFQMSSNDLSELLYRRLKGKRYLIVVDDIWNIEAWKDIKRSFPNDNNGSKIMLTTQLREVAFLAQVNKNPLFLRFLTKKESWDLFQKKTFITGISPCSLEGLGKEITRNCQGLPLAIVVIAGVLKNNFQRTWWEQVAESVGLYIANDPKQYIDTLALSYNYLPQHLKPCFLYLGVFPEDHEIPVQNLIWLWIAEGFIRRIGRKSLEDVAEEYLKDLLKRSLIIVVKKGSDCRIKTFRIHVLLRDLCLRKAKEESFSPKIYRYLRYSYYCAHSSSSSPSYHCPFANTQCANSIDLPYICEGFELARALDLSSLPLCIFPSELLQLLHLRYLEIKFTCGSSLESISNLVDLETLVILSRTNIIIPANMWKMVKLRHLYIKSGENLVQNFGCEEVPDLLENLQTLSLVSPSRSCERILARTPNLRKLGLCGHLTSKSGDLNFPDLGLLNHLETLKLLNIAPKNGPGGASNSIMFPETLKRLTVSNTILEWKQAWIFEMIPNLEVLKLKIHAFVGDEWETSDGVFCRLKFLKFEELDIVEWRASGDHFPVLQRLVVCRCMKLSEIPSSLGDILTLECIELSGCNESAMNSASDIQKEQEDNGNDYLKILISPSASSSYRPESEESNQSC